MTHDEVTLGQLVLSLDFPQPEKHTGSHLPLPISHRLNICHRIISSHLCITTSNAFHISSLICICPVNNE